MFMLGPDKERHFIGYAALSLVVFSLIVFLSPRSAYVRRWAFVAWLMMVASAASEFESFQQVGRTLTPPPRALSGSKFRLDFGPRPPTVRHLLIAHQNRLFLRKLPD